MEGKKPTSHNEALFLKKGLHQIEEEESALQVIDSDLEWDNEDTKEEERKKEQYKKQILDKKGVRDYESQKSKGTLKVAVDEQTEGDTRYSMNDKLDNLWKRVRYFLDDLNEKGERKETPAKPIGNRLKFMNACKDLDMLDRGILTKYMVERAFNTARFVPALTSMEYDQLFKALEVYQDEDVNYRKLLEAPIKREPTSVNGIFPVIKQLDDLKRKEDEEKKRKDLILKEEKKKQEQVEKRIEDMKKMGIAQPTYKKPTKEELKMQERQEQLKKEEEQKKKELEMKEEAEQVKKEVSEYRKAIEYVQKTIRQSGEHIRNWFKLVDKDGDNQLDLMEIKDLLSKAKVSMRDHELEKVFDLMDSNQNGKISYNEFCDVIEKNELPSVEDIVKKRRKERVEAGMTANMKGQKQGDSFMQTQNMKSVFAEIGSQSKGDHLKDLGSIDNMSSIMNDQLDRYASHGKFIEDDDTLKIYNELKEILMSNNISFDDILLKMGQSKFQQESKVTFDDFERLIKSMPGTYKYSNLQLRQVFQQYATHGKTPSDQYISLVDFKDRFFPGIHYERMNKGMSNNDLIKGTPSGTTSHHSSSKAESRSESMHVDAMLAGKKYDDILKDKDLQNQRLLKEKEDKYRAQGRGNMHLIHEDKYEINSQSSAPSKGVDEIIKNNYDPRKKQQVGKDPLTQMLEKEAEEQMKYKANKDFYRQNEAIIKQMPLQEKFLFDRSLDMFFKKFCKALMDEISSGPVKRDPKSYVDHYGKEYKGFLSFQEFKEIYAIHVQSREDFKPNQSHQQNQNDPKLRALFSLFDANSSGRISEKEFTSTLISQKPSSTLLERMSFKVKKGGDRMIRVLEEEFQEADIPYGCLGSLPIANFQTIMIDYDLHVLESDIQELRKKAIVVKDNDLNEFVKYNMVIDQVKPKKITTDIQVMEKMIIRIQANWRGHVARKHVYALASNEMKAALDGMDKHKKGRRVSFKAGEFEIKEIGSKVGVIEDKNIKRKLTLQQKKEEADKKKKAMVNQAKTKRKKTESLEARMGVAVKMPKDNKINERQIQVRKEMTEYIKTNILDQIINTSIAFGESLQVGRDIQKNFEHRPVTKYVFPLIQEFQYNVMGVQPKSLQSLNELGQIMFLDSESQLSQYDIPSSKTLQPVNLGTRPPLKHYDIIDMICDQTSARIYTLNSNWILKIWNIEQNVSLPQKRLAVCTNEGNKDYIALYYKNTFNHAKPKFLSLSDHNQQILVANTSCVDGCIVFIDPISFSLLKKIQLRYQDYEIPKKVRESISRLKLILSSILQKSKKSVVDIFIGITQKNSEIIYIKDFVQKLILLDPILKADELFAMCNQLDEDNDGSISLDEFLQHFQHLEQDQNDFDKLKEEEELSEKIWPEWVIKEGQLDQAKNLIGMMFDTLEKKHGISAESAFGIYDTKDRGLTTIEEFKRILRIFFSDVLIDQKDIDFLMRMTQKTVDQNVMYREFSKFLNKRFVRTFRNANTSIASVNQSDFNQDLKELDQVLKKEASLNYVIRKAAELNIDLRTVFIKNDESELSVIPRLRFWRILENLPLGLLSHELDEIFENDLHYDNYGNVDYTVIINSDMFVTLERQRFRRLIKKQQMMNKKQGPDDTLDLSKDTLVSNINTNMDKFTDNRKVVVEDLIYIDDLEILIYTTIAPKTSTIFISHTKKVEKEQAQTTVEIVNLSNIKEHQKKMNGQQTNIQTNPNELMPNYYQLLARLKGHKNTDPPTLLYIPQSGCLISGEKHISEGPYQSKNESYNKASDPTVPVSHQFAKSNETVYDKHSNREEKGQYKSEILIWNIQRDLIELFQTNPPWNVPIFRRFLGHNASIIDICYLQKAQLLVTTSTDQTIRFFDPISASFSLTDPNNIPHSQQRPGYYKPLLKESTVSNATFKEVKRIYTGTDTSCFTLRTLNIQNIHLDPHNNEQKSQIEWIIGLKLGKPQSQGRKNTQSGFICGYGIERVKIEVPAIHVDDIVPPYVMKECEDLIQVRRKRLITSFQQQLPHQIERIYSQVSLQNSYISQIRKMFLDAILNRKDLKYVNPEPLREIYKIILKLPNRNKFQNFLATSGCSDKLSVSETFFYLQIFTQIHPLRTTQIEFEKSIEEFQRKHQREFLRGVKRWPKKSIQKFADYIRINGIDIHFLQNDKYTANQNKPNDFCTRERFIQYFNDVVSQVERFSDEEIYTILNELDPYFTGIIQIYLIQSYFKEEIHYYNITKLNRPKQIFDEIRSKIFPNKKLAIQQALTSVDIQGDGYIQVEQFIEAFQKADVTVDRQVLEFLFDVVAEKFNTVQDKGSTTNLEIKVLSITYFINKLFNDTETKELLEVQQTLQHIKASLVYKGLDYSIIFAENSIEQVRNKRGGNKPSLEDTQVLQQKIKDQPIDLTLHYTRFAQQLVKDEFCQRLSMLNADRVSQEQVLRLANFLCLNQKNASIVYLNAWLHHLQRVSAAFQVPDKHILPMICSKLLRNENVLRSYIESTADLKGRRESEKIIDIPDLRQVLSKFGVNYVNQEIFLNEFTKNDKVHVEDLVARMKNCLQQAYNIATSQLNQSLEAPSANKDTQTLQDLTRTDYFEKVQTKLRSFGNKISFTDLVNRCRAFDPAEQGKIKVYHFINILKHNYHQIFDADVLIGLQFELEALNSDNCVDYEEFVKIFIEKQNINLDGDNSNQLGFEVKLDKRSAYQIADYEDLLSRISSHTKAQGLDLLRVFKIYSNPQGTITYEQMKKIFTLIEFNLSDTEYRLLLHFADENGDGTISAYEFSHQIIHSKEISPSFDISKWIVASRVLDGRYQLLEKVKSKIKILKDALKSEYGEGGHHSGVATGEQFQNLIRDSQIGMSEYDIDLVTIYAIKGSKRQQMPEKANNQLNYKHELIQFKNFKKSLKKVILSMKKEVDDKKFKDSEQDMFKTEMDKFKKELELRQKAQNDLNKKKDPLQVSRELQLKNKIMEIFQEREVSFFECFQHLYDPLNSQKSMITISQFKKAVNSLNLPLTVQEHRILRRIADPGQIGKVDLKSFCLKFENEVLRVRRLNTILEKVSTAFFMQNFNLRRAFTLFDKDGDGTISIREFRQGWLALNLGLTYDEIDDLQKIVDVNKSGSISYDEFISAMEIHIKKKEHHAANQAKELVFLRIKSLLENNKDSLVEIMYQYDIENTGYILKQDLARSFQKLGILHPDPHMPTLIQAGGYREQDEKIDYVIFCQNLIKSIETTLGLNLRKSHEIIQKIYALIKHNKWTIFDAFCTLDVNLGGRLSKVEFKTGIQRLGLQINNTDFEVVWKFIKKPVKKLNNKDGSSTQRTSTQETPRSASNRRSNQKELQQPDLEEMSYYELLTGFVNGGCLKLQKSIDNTNNLVNKLRVQLKKKNISVEKAYKQFDPDDRKFVFRHDFVNECFMMGLEFTEEEFDNIFQYICQVGTKGTESSNQQVQQQERKTQKATTRFTFKQFHDAILVKRDENWLFQSYIKIHGIILQKNLTYKRIFNQWREKNTKTQQGRLSQKELKVGLKKLKAGLTQDEIEKLISSIQFEGKDNSISSQDFERLVVSGARKLEQEKTFEKLLIQEWITTFNEGIVKNDFPVERIFQEHDSQQKGALTFEEFVMMNQFVGLATNKKDLKKTFDIIDRNKKGKIRLEEIRNVQSLIASEEQNQNNEDEQINQSVNESVLQQELDDMYENIKDKLEKKNTTLESIVYDQLKYMPNQFANTKGIQQVFEKLQIILSKNEVEKILQDVRKDLKGKYECSFKDFIDFMTKKRINVAFLDKGFIDPLIAQCCQNISKAIGHYEIAIEKLFNIFDKQNHGYLTKTIFMKCIQGMELGIAIEDLIEFFNYLDDKDENKISRLQFIDGLTFITNRIGGGSKLEQALSSGVQTTKKGFSLRQQVFGILKKLSEAVQHKNFQMRQIIALFDQNNTGFLSRAEFMQIVKQLEGGINIEEARLLLSFYDDKNTGKISVIEFVKSLQGIMNGQTGGNVYHYLQVNPIIQKIINQLAIDSDKFFDELAELNERLLDQQLKEMNQVNSMATRIKVQTKAQISGLSKRLFFQHLNRYGVNLDEDEKTLFNTVFGIQDAPDKFDYDKIDTVFEAVQQQLYAQEQFYTVEWERRIFKKIGEYLRRNNLTIHQCFNLIDEDNSQTISIEELRNALIRFQIGISDNEIKKFLERIDEQQKKFITQSQFIKRFWAAYTYENVFGESQQHGDKGTKAGGLSDKISRYRMFHSIQFRLKQKFDINTVFKTLDSGIGFLVLKDFQEGLNKGFGITLKRDEVIKLFVEIDEDKDGLVKYKEFEVFIKKNYDQALQMAEKEQQQVNIQYEIFDHMMKVLEQKSLTLAEVFEQIDNNKNGYVEVDEFQNLLERLGFTISEAQVYELMRQMDENFDGRISYNELKAHIQSLGFSVVKENKQDFGQLVKSQAFIWRDKGIEVLIRALNKNLNKKPFESFFEQFDADHDDHLTPNQFRQSLLSMGDREIKKFQIERILHLLVDEKKSMPLISIHKLSNFFKNYQYNENDGNSKKGSSSVLIDEDLFVYIVEKYDGFSRLVEQITILEDKTSYLQRHVFELNLRGLNMLSNQKTVENLHKKTIKLNDLFQSTLILLAGEANRIMKDEAQICVLDPTYNINTIVNDQNTGVLNSIQLPLIENSAFDIDFATLEYLPSGAQRYLGLMPENRKRVEILIYPNDDLSYVSLDGKAFKKHLQLEQQVHRYLMGAQFDDQEIEMDSTHMDVFLNYGRFEKKIGLAANDKEIYIVNELINQDEWISLDEFVVKNGGILNIPLFYHTDAPLFIIRHWAKKILQIIQKVHDVSAILRCLNLKQIFVSRDGQRVKLGHLRGVGKVNNLGNVGTCPDIYLTLENNLPEDKYANGSQGSVGFRAGSSSKKTETQKSFSNRALDNPFIAPELLFQKFSDHTSALDVWSFGMIMYCILVGQEPDSFYSIYRGWYKKQHGHDIELAQLPFIPPSQSNFLYDPFSIDFDNPFKTEELALNQELNIPGSLIEKTGTLKFENCMKCIKNLSHSSLFQEGNSKKFQFKSLAQSIRDTSQQKDQPPKFPGQSHSNDDLRKKLFQTFAKSSVLERKNELGLILDIIASCLDSDPKRRPTITGLLHSPLFQLDKYELTNAVRFSENVILYRSPQSSVSLRIATPLRQMCAVAINSPEQLLQIEADIVKMFALTQECLMHISTLPLDQINSVLTEDEKRRGLMQTGSVKQFKGKDYFTMRVSPNSPLAAQIIEDKIIDMLIFLTLRYFKVFNAWKLGRLDQIGKDTQSILKHQSSHHSQSSKKKSVKFQDNQTDRLSQYQTLNLQQQQIKQTERLQNTIMQRMCDLLKTLVYEMHSYSTPMAPFVKEVLEYIVKFYVGEEYQLGSDQVLRSTSGMDSSLKDYLLSRSFFRRDKDLAATFKSDRTDKLWHTEQKNKSFLDKSNYWNTALHKEALRIYKDAITESGLGQSCYPVINDYITNVNNSFEPSKIFSRQMNQICTSFLIPMSKTSKYYDELIPITDCLSRLQSDQLEKAGKRCLLAVIRSVFQTGTSDKIKACLDIRVPKHIIHFLQDTDSNVRHESLLIFLEMSKGLQDEDYEIIGKNASQMKKEFSKRAYERTAFDQHKSISMMSQQQDVSKKLDEEGNIISQQSPGKTKQQSKRGKSQQSQADMMANLIKRTTALIEKNENDKYINFAMDLPNLNFLANKRFLKEMSICFESPVFIAPLIRLLKSPLETHQNKEIILEILANLFCGNEKVLIAINSPACDTYMTLLKMLMSNSKIQQAKSNLSSVSASTRHQLALQDKVIELYQYIFEQRRPTIIRDLSCIGAAATLLKEQGLTIPNLINLPEIIAFVDEFSQLSNLKASMIIIDDFITMISDLRCWIKHFYSESQIPELTRIKAIQRSINLVIRVVNLIWADFPNVHKEKGDYLLLIKTCISLMDWLCVRNQEHFIFNEQSGKYNLDFIMDKCTFALSAFRHPQYKANVPVEDLTHNTKSNKEIQMTRKYDMFPFTDVGTMLQNILYQLVRKNDPFLNQLLSEADFGFVFGEQLILEYDFIRHCIDNKIESMVLIDTYVKKNEIRLNTYEYLMRSNEQTIKYQFIKSNFIDKMFNEYILDFREFNIQFSKIDLEFLAFRKTFPIRLEAISLLNTSLVQKERAPGVYTELIMYAKRHFMIKNEVDLLRKGKMGNEEATSLLLFSIILESNDEDLVYAMMQEGAHKVIRDMIKEFPSLSKRFPILNTFTNKF